MAVVLWLCFPICDCVLWFVVAFYILLLCFDFVIVIGTSGPPYFYKLVPTDKPIKNIFSNKLCKSYIHDFIAVVEIFILFSGSRYRWQGRQEEKEANKSKSSLPNSIYLQT